MKIVHFGDIHIWRNPFVTGDLGYPKRYLGAANLLMNRRKKFPRQLGQAVVSHILAEEADLLVFSGDLTTASLKSEFRAAAEMFRPLYEKWGERFVVIPGNHDRYTARSVRKDWYSQAFPYGAIDKIRSVEVDNYRVVAFDASREFMFRSNGLFTEEMEVLLDEELAKWAKKKVILVGHYPIDYPEGVVIDSHHELIRRASLKRIVEKYPPLVYLHGHKHVRWFLGNAINCGSAGMLSSDPTKHAGYACVKLENHEIAEVSFCHLDRNGELVRKPAPRLGE